jgi:hypothetical protein
MLVETIIRARVRKQEGSSDHQCRVGRLQYVSSSSARCRTLAVGVLREAVASPLAWLELYGMLILIGLFFILPMLGAQLGVDLSIFSQVIASSTSVIIDANFE